MRGKAIEYYNRHKCFDFFDCSCLYVADPGLTATVRGTWFQGDKSFFAIEHVVNDIRKIGAEFDFSENKIILYGSSQGGFAALASGAFLTSARVFAECRKNDITKFNLREDVHSALESRYGSATIQNIPENLRYRLSLESIFSHRSYSPKATVIVKETDKHCIDIHLKPLQVATGDRLSINVLHGKHGLGGHSGADKELVVDLIKYMR